MKVLYLGDVVGRSGRDAVVDQLPRLRRDLGLDFVLVNGENAAGGFGITQEICLAFYEAGADVILTGNHVWDKREALSYIEQDGRLLRPANFPAGTPGRGAAVFTTTPGDKVLVVQVMGRVFMDPLDDPFAVLDRELARHSLGGTVQCIIVDIHGEATSEKTAFGHHCDGRVSMVAGTHTHIPPVDTRIIEYREPDGRLAAVALTDWLSDGVSGVYKFFALDRTRTSPGSYVILWHIEHARSLGLPYVYLGYWIGESRKMAYKMRFQPLEALHGEQWLPFEPGPAVAVSGKSVTV